MSTKCRRKKPPFKERNSPYQKTRHHRRPRRLGGNGGEENISLLPRYEHEAWHLLFNHLHAVVIAQLINAWGVFPRRVYVHCRDPAVLAHDFPSGVPPLKVKKIPLRMSAREQEAWSALWEGKTPEEILSDINCRFLDPAYYFSFQPNAE